MSSDKYDHQAIEKKWQERWAKEGAFRSTNAADGVYVLDMFPYPSGDGLHVGHPEGYTATDIYTRYLRMNGKNVLHPMGWDAFGLPAENYAIKMGVHPADVTEKNIANFKRQIQSLGFSYDWDREVNTTDPKYYKWTQWIFLQLFKAGLAYEKEAPIWWCPKDKTGLANEEVVNGKCDRCGTTVEKKMLKQWMLKITAYADRLLDGLNDVDWPEGIKALQRNWIGKSEGAEVVFGIPNCSRLLFVHGKHAQAQEKWYVPMYEVAKRLGYEVVAEDMPHTDEPVFEEWESVINNAKPDQNTVLVGHSRGCAAILRWLEKAPSRVKVKKVILVSGAIGEGRGIDVAEGFYGKSYNYDKIKTHCDDFVVIHGTDDDVIPFSAAEENAKQLKATLYSLDGRGHFDSADPIIELHQELSKQVTVFTTRPDTLFGATYLVLSPEHELVKTITTPEQKKAVEAYCKKVASKSDRERMSEGEKEKTGVFTGAYAINPVNNEKIPVWIADYVLSSYGTGAIMAVPAHDERDFAFATKFKLPIREVVTSETQTEGCWSGEGIMKNSSEFDGLHSTEARKKIVQKLSLEQRARMTTQFKLRDWVFSRQRYWGEPIPLVHCEKCGVVPVPEDQLPLELPNVEKYEPTGTGESPLAGISAWVNTECPKCGGAAKRETNTMPQWAGSCWYYLRYCDPTNDKEFASAAALKAWLPVDMYVGGAEHAVLHLMYARFWHKVLFDAGFIPKEVGDEPFKKLKNQGLILGPDGEKMSKSRGNVINPDEIVEKYGADTLRMYEMFMGPFEDAKPWDTNGILGVRRFLEKVWRAAERVDDSAPNNRWHKYAQNIFEGIETFRLNTCVSDFMKWANEWGTGPVSKQELSVFLCLLSPLAPHIAEELWSHLGHTTLLAQEAWPKFDPTKTKDETVTITVQVMGKLRGTLAMPAGVTQAEVENAAKAEPNVAKYLTSEPKKVIFVKDKLINFVV